MRLILSALALVMAGMLAVVPASAAPMAGAASAAAVEKAADAEPLVQNVHRRRYGFSYGYGVPYYGYYSYRPRYYYAPYAYYYPAPRYYGYYAPSYRYYYKRKHRDWDDDDWDD